ncbi:hypothetical protein BB558_004720 [Smittium angustum]|uniref:non-specific serine/threonine protein kinase n=1 Tax=Smittium angustum TaxID=133377 RepID=A0A2U1J2J3_SMIAN|nr:hypothetical protein BB558_004720 [Smittium angustum]
MRYQDQAVVVLPYIKNEDFRSYYLSLPLKEMKYYFKSLFEALAHTHKKKVIHRDVKPSNFLYSVQNRHGVLVDFGLAERESEQEIPKPTENSIQKANSEKKSKVASYVYRNFNENGIPGVPRKDYRPSIRANRAGTRGFRAPEVLFKVQKQSTSIDVWSAGSTDDTEALLEIAVLFGKVQMERLAFDLNRTFFTNIPTVKDKGIKFEALIKTYSSDSWKSDPDYHTMMPSAIDLLKKCLALHPSKRISAAETLNHPFLCETIN